MLYALHLWTHHHQVSILGSVDHVFTAALKIHKALFAGLDVKPHTTKQTMIQYMYNVCFLNKINNISLRAGLNIQRQFK